MWGRTWSRSVGSRKGGLGPRLGHRSLGKVMEARGKVVVSLGKVGDALGDVVEALWKVEEAL
jgi:hypothetical protein